MSYESSPRRSPRRARHSMAAMTSSASKENTPATSAGSVAGRFSDVHSRFDTKAKSKMRMSLPAASAVSVSVGTSRRQLAPRKSALKATQQVFQSPTGLVASPINRPTRGQTMMIYGTSQMPNIDDIFAGFSQEVGESEVKTAPIQPVSRDREPSESQKQAGRPPQASERKMEEESENEPRPRKRRVTFSRRQEKTDFISDEPTMSIRPASEYEPAASDTSNTQSSAAQAQDQESEDEDDDSDSDSDSDVEEYRKAKRRAASAESSDMDIITTANLTTYTGYAFTDTSLGDVDDDTRTMEFTTPFAAGNHRDSIAGEAMDMDLTAPFGARSGRQSTGSETVDMDLDESSASLHDDSVEGAGGDRTQTMQFTGVFHSIGCDSEGSYRTESSTTEVQEDAEREEGEASMEFTQPFTSGKVDEGGLSRISEEDSAMLEEISRQSVTMDFTRPFNSVAQKLQHTEKVRRDTQKHFEERVGDTTPVRAPRTSSSGSQTSTPNRIRDKIPFGHASPNYKHSPARRVMPSEAEEPKPSPKRSPRKEIVVPAQSRQSLSAIPPHVFTQQPRHSGDSSLESASSNFSARVLPDMQLTLQSFLDAMGLKFQDQLSAVRPRVARPNDLDHGRLGPNVVRWSKVAAGGSVLLENLSRSCKELEGHIETSREALAEVANQFDAQPPAYARDVMSYPPEMEKERKLIEAQFKLQKQCARAHSVGQYYGWRLDNEYDEDTVKRLQANRRRLDEDAAKLAAKSLRLREELLPELRARHAQLKAELQAEKLHQAAVAASDQEELGGIHAAIEDQMNMLESFRSENREALETLERVQARVNEQLERKHAAEDGIAAARSACEQIKGFTRGEAARLLSEIRSIEQAHLWTLISATETHIALLHNSVIDVNLNISVEALVQSVSITSRASSDRNGLYAFVTDALQHSFKCSGVLKPMEAVRRISNAFTAQRHLQAEVDAMLSCFPTEVAKLSDEGVQVKASVLLTKRKAKLRVLAPCKRDALIAGSAILFLPEEIQVELVYGSVDAPAVQAQIADMLGAAPSLRSLAQACVKSIATFDA
ncbi:hypothetical protein K437DRAFT_272011 [Tilletiaria anomala UBC 951]|uniref:Spc7 kinetochore protein domain-containing protein n=1 Tax=Tilletiaria anomala (strain ATCC 24038 / CBS 436.72 / UBC 951) TaxID=1037660 RepID=A0A066WG66_TILAU|nr:uncharacterized protein K437DRAFT_272011 [Tilletiaria anomala UBC 951]KDN52957.1 hypothetical protein K437DRAFT_272011 [Tilletiaria anomala UBC 951]